MLVRCCSRVVSSSTWRQWPEPASSRHKAPTPFVSVMVRRERSCQPRQIEGFLTQQMYARCTRRQSSGGRGKRAACSARWSVKPLPAPSRKATSMDKAPGTPHGEAAPRVMAAKTLHGPQAAPPGCHRIRRPTRFFRGRPPEPMSTSCCSRASFPVGAQPFNSTQCFTDTFRHSGGLSVGGRLAGEATSLPAQTVCSSAPTQRQRHGVECGVVGPPPPVARAWATNYQREAATTSWCSPGEAPPPFACGTTAESLWCRTPTVVRETQARAPNPLKVATAIKTTQTRNQTPTRMVTLMWPRQRGYRCLGTGRARTCLRHSWRGTWLQRPSTTLLTHHVLFHLGLLWLSGDTVQDTRHASIEGA